jgi:hypothetical protein
MTISEIQEIQQSEAETLFPIQSCETLVGGYDCVNDYVAFPIIVNVSFQTYEYKDVIDDEGSTKATTIPTTSVIKNQNDDEIGHIFYSNNSQQLEKIDISESKYVAYLIDTNKEICGIEYRLNKDYLVIKKQYFDNYIADLKKTSILWGGFYHEDDKKITPPILQIKAEIICLPDLKLRTDFHIDNAQRAILQPYAFERFLKNYHLLELLFDYDVIQKIALNQHNIKVAGEILYKTYKESDEIYRLKYLLEKCYDLPKIINCLNKITAFEDLAIDIFYEYGKESNPLKDKQEFLNILQKTTLFAIESFYKINNQGVPDPSKLILQITSYPTFIYKLMAYWIYRIRSSIAHSKIGEFLLTSSEPEHERFMVEFAEPLLQEILIQCFKQ